MRVVTLAESDRAAAEAFEIPYRDDGDGVSFMANHRVARLVARQRLARRWPELTVALLDDGRCVARGVCIPFSSAPDDRVDFPDAGWEQAVLWAAADALDDRVPDTLCALEIADHPEAQRQGLSYRVLDGMRHNAAAGGFRRLIAPVRPPLKARDPWTSMADYAARSRADGLPVDPWLRVHVRAGGSSRSPRARRRSPPRLITGGGGPGWLSTATARSRFAAGWCPCWCRPGSTSAATSSPTSGSTIHCDRPTRREVPGP